MTRTALPTLVPSPLGREACRALDAGRRLAGAAVATMKETA